MFKRILVALKFTPAGQRALEKGIMLAKEHGAKLHIFHAMDYRLTKLDAVDPKLIDVNKKIKKRFDSEVKPLLNGFNNVTFGCMPSDPALEVCKIARHTKSDLIVLGSHQRLEKRCMGRIDYVGITVLEKSPCPVMLVPF
jgi:nucleotide-binding universal stress UspA family protein